MSKKPLADRIAAALREDAPSVAMLAALVSEVLAATTALDRDEQSLHRMAVDPFSDSASAKQARERAEQIEFEQERLTEAKGALQTALEKARDRDEQVRITAEWDVYVAEHAAMVQEIREVYPPAAEAIAALIHKVETFKRQGVPPCPRGLSTVLGDPECVARGFQPNNTLVVRLASGVRLPAFDGDVYRQLWPPRETASGVNYEQALAQMRRPLNSSRV